MISQINTPSFKGYIPVKYYAIDSETGETSPILSNENLRKCHGFVVRNLNRTSKGAKNENFVKMYREKDPDYRRIPTVTSFYDGPDVYLITGKDVDTVKEMAKPIGIAKGASMDRLGHAKSFEAKAASRKYANNIKNFLFRKCKRLTDGKENELTMKVYFNPKFTRTQTLKGFEYERAEFVTEG